ncbi:uncharacterized protein LOC124529771 [Vanessa cardui]|uniref:uncharacterized protein LOC124529771 n=1 Tax=Vanessa cardui TaxID=171605 RepID=UPI001F1493F9|nr:uncharacterized protein LOC124529771 [Vanessa cardui]
MSNNDKRNKRRRRGQTPPNSMEEILTRLRALEEQSRASVETQASGSAGTSRAVALQSAAPAAASTPGAPTPPRGHVVTPPPTPQTSQTGLSQSEDVVTNAAERLLTAISCAQVRSNRYFVSDFDPSVHDFDTWCDEVERARILNQWGDKECLARIGHCLKGESRTWLSQWTSDIRTWSNFKLELKALCPRSVDVANVLYDVMRTESDKYSTYAEYARRSLLKLRIVKGLSNELLTAIIIRGIVDPQIRAMAINAKLSPDSIVEFLSSFVKPSNNSNRKISTNYSRFDKFSNNNNLNRNLLKRNLLKRKYSSNDSKSIKCYHCSNPNRYATRELRRQRAEELIRDNRNKQDAYVNKNRKPPKKYQVNDLVYVIKNSQSTGKLDSESNDDNAEQLSDVVGVTGPSTSSSEGFGDAAPSGEAVLEED